jgi:zinc transport system permease protein
MQALGLPYPLDTAEMQRALIACVAVGAFAPMIGTFLVQKRLALVGDGIGHVAFAGVGAGLLLTVWPVWTALLFAVVGAMGVEWLRLRRKASGDLALALFFYTGIALGAVFASGGPGHDVELETLPFLFGDPLAISAAGLWVIVGIGATVLVAGVALGGVLFAVVTDEDWSRVSGLPVTGVSLGLAVVAAAVIVGGMRVVGILLIAALMVLPVASAQLLARSFRQTLRLAVAIGAGAALVGLIVARPLGVSVGGSIVLTAGVIFAIVAASRRGVPPRLPVEETAP